MKFNKIVGFGDSWIYGDELLDPTLEAAGVSFWDDANTAYREKHCFLGLLGQHYQVPVENYGIPGGSLQSTIWTYLTWMQQDTEFQNSLIIIWLTESDRNSFYNPETFYPWKFWKSGRARDQYVHSTWVDSQNSGVSAKFVNLVKQFQVISNCHELAKLNYQQAVLFFDGQAARHNLSLLQFNCAPVPCRLSLPTLINPDHDWITDFRDNPQNQNRELIYPGGHPNQMGHQAMSEKLILDIDCAILQ